MADPQRVFVPVSDDYIFENPEILLSDDFAPFATAEEDVQTAE